MIKTERKWVYNLFSKPLNSAEKFPLQKGQKFAIFPSPTPTIEYISATEHICDSIGEKASLEKITVLNTMPKSIHHIVSLVYMVDVGVMFLV